MALPFVSPIITNASSAVSAPILIIGAAGFIGRFIAEASLASKRPTYLLVRPSPTETKRNNVVKALEEKGATTIFGSINDRDFMEKMLREHGIEVVVSTVGGAGILDQPILVEAIKAVGTVKRFLPSEFGHDIDRADPVEPGLTFYNEKRKVRRLIEALGIPYTYICCNSIAAWPYYDNHHPSDVLPPLDQIPIYGDGNKKAYFIDGVDIGKFTLKAIEDSRTINKCVHFRPPNNCLSINELGSLWEKKLNRALPRVTISEDDLLAIAKENDLPRSIVAALTHDIFINGCQTNFCLDQPNDLEVTSLYPDIPFKSISDCFDEFLVKVSHPVCKELKVVVLVYKPQN
ncbi:hypothetical protein Syun_021559 [Stephania yunnanensis]|uniref:NmrA-like domain-containing protein n=1 Tax=Stephania yunnanensis TaxID=152371 RepID=A0AAP0IG80_9MAGN